MNVTTRASLSTSTLKKLGRIGSVGHRITGRQTGVVNRHLGIGWEFVHVCIDDASRIAFRAFCFWVYAYPAFLMYAAHSLELYWVRISPQAAETDS